MARRKSISNGEMQSMIFSDTDRQNIEIIRKRFNLSTNVQAVRVALQLSANAKIIQFTDNELTENQDGNK